MPRSKRIFQSVAKWRRLEGEGLDLGGFHTQVPSGINHIDYDLGPPLFLPLMIMSLIFDVNLSKIEPC